MLIAVFQVYVIIILFNKIQIQTPYRHTCPQSQYSGEQIGVH